MLCYSEKCNCRRPNDNCSRPHDNRSTKIHTTTVQFVNVLTLLAFPVTVIIYYPNRSFNYTPSIMQSYIIHKQGNTALHSTHAEKYTALEKLNIQIASVVHHKDLSSIYYFCNIWLAKKKKATGSTLCVGDQLEWNTHSLVRVFGTCNLICGKGGVPLRR